APGRPPVVSRPAAEPRRGGGTGAVTDAGGVPEPSRERRKCPLRAVILAGGTGTRLRPLTYWTNKHLLPVGHYPMICYGVARLRQAGIRDIILVTGRSAVGGFADVLGSGRDWGVSLTYRLQEEAGGIAQALDLARPLLGAEE